MYILTCCIHQYVALIHRYMSLGATHQWSLKMIARTTSNINLITLGSRTVRTGGGVKQTETGINYGKVEEMSLEKDIHGRSVLHLSLKLRA